MQAVKDEICPFGSGVRISIQSLVLFSAFSPEKKFRIFFQYFVVRFVEMAVKCQIEKHISGRADIAQLFSDVQVTFFLTESVPAEIPHPFQLKYQMLRCRASVQRDAGRPEILDAAGTLPPGTAGDTIQPLPEAVELRFSRSLPGGRNSGQSILRCPVSTTSFHQRA